MILLLRETPSGNRNGETLPVMPEPGHRVSFDAGDGPPASATSAGLALKALLQGRQAGDVIVITIGPQPSRYLLDLPTYLQ